MNRYTTGELMTKLFFANIRPIMFVAGCTALGFLFGSAWAGLAVGVVVIAIATLI
jgi:hypothetical protein